MRLHTETYTVYKFNELSDDAKQKALDNNRDWNVDHEWWDCIYETMTTAGSMLGIDIANIYFSGFWSQGDGACFVGSYSYKPQWRKALTSEFGKGEFLNDLLSIGSDLQEIQRKRFYKINARIVQGYGSGNYCHENTVTLDADLDNGEWITDDEERELLATLREFMQLIYSKLESEHEYLTSDEAIRDSLEYTDVEFYENGDIA